MSDVKTLILHSCRDLVGALHARAAQASTLKEQQELQRDASALAFR
jgi:hypothetical protein